MATSEMSALATALATATTKKQRLCLAGEWLESLDPEDKDLLMSQVDSIPKLTVYRAISPLVSFSDQTWARHFNHACPCYSTGAMHV